MDVRCSRCGTEYDFDDALVSERGTTVKCTNCAHQFKVYAGGGPGGAPERWVVRKGSGRELVYTSLRDLQRAIAQRQVGPTDLLSRGGQPLRTLGSIAELEPFFAAQGPAGGATVAAPQPQDDAHRTLMGISPGSSGGGKTTEDTVRDSGPFGESVAPTRPAAQLAATRNSSHTPAGGIAAPRRPPPAAPPAPPQRSMPPPAQPTAQPVPYRRFEEPEPKTVPRNPTPDVPAVAPRAAAPVPAAPPAPQVREQPGSGAFRAYQDSFSDESLPAAPPPRRMAARWIVGLLVLGAVAFVGGTLGVRYLRSMGTAPAPTAAPADDRVKKLLEAAEADLSRGDFESAKEQLDKASVLAESDVAVLTALAHLEAARADTHWLTLRLLDPTHPAELDAERASLAQRLGRVRKAVDSATRVAPSSPAVLLLRIDAARLSDEVPRARELVPSLGTDTSQPDTAYVLAALDLAEANPTWPTVIDRLRTAASVERGVGRARPALVYALAASGAADDARAELAKLESAGGSPTLVAKLRAFVDRRGAAAAPASASAAALPAPSAAPEAPAPSASAAPPPAPTDAPATTAVAAASPPPAGAAPRGTDFRKLLEDASAAKRSGDLGNAAALYQAALEQQPGNVEALGGLGDVARMRGDTSAAMRYYDSVLQQNPTYLPALIASADLKWSSGDRDGALKLYKRVVNQTDPGSSYGQKAAARIAEAQGGGGQAPSTPPATAPTPKPEPAPEKPSTPPAEDLPQIDTSDLPGFK